MNVRMLAYAMAIASVSLELIEKILVEIINAGVVISEASDGGQK